MAVDWAEIHSEVAGVIAEEGIGTEAQLYSQTLTGDRAAGTATQSLTLVDTFDVVFTVIDRRLIDGRRILPNDKEVLAFWDGTITAAHLLRVGSTTYTIEEVEPVDPSGSSPIVQTVRIRA